MKHIRIILFVILCAFLCLTVTACRGSSGGVSKPAPTGDETTDLLNSISAELSQKLSGYYDETGHVAVSDTEAVIAEASAYFRSLAEKGTLTVAEVGTESIVLDLPDGSSAVYTVPQAGMAGGGTDLTIYDFCRDALTSDENASDDFLTVMPWFRHDLFSDGRQFRDILAEEHHDRVDDPNGRFLYYDSDSAPLSAAHFLDNISTFHTDGVWEIIGHGTYTRSYGTLITSSLVPSPENDALFADDLKNKRMFYTLSGWQTPDDDKVFFLDYTYSHYMLGSRFFDEHLNRDALEGAVVYLGVCSGLRDETLSDVFLSKGARAVYGFTKPIAIPYVLLMSDIANILTTRRFELNDFYPDLTTDYRGTEDYRYPSFQETLVIARELYRDPDPFDTGTEDRGRLIMYTKNRDGALIQDAAACFEGGRGTLLDPYIITSGDNLEYMRRYSLSMSTSRDDEAGFAGLYMEMANDISATDFEGFPKEFLGSFDGGGHTIYDLDLTKCVYSIYNEYALFGRLNGAALSNLTLSGPDIYLDEKYADISAFAGYAENSEFVNCINKINIICGDTAAGIVRSAVSCKISGCRNEGTVQANAAGGIVESADGCTFADCINEGAVLGTAVEMPPDTPGFRGEYCSSGIAAGIVRDGDECRITGCINRGTVTADDGYSRYYDNGNLYERIIPGYASGIIVSGSGPDDPPTVIENCANYGTVGKDHNGAAQISFGSGISVSGSTEQGEVASTPVPEKEQEAAPDTPKEPEKEPEETNEPETPETEEEKPKKGKIIVGGLYDFDAPVCPSGLTYIITITADGELEGKTIESVTKSALSLTDAALDVSFDREVKDDVGYIYLTVNWNKPGTYRISVTIDGKAYTAAINVR